MEARVELAHSGDRTWTSCTQERTFVGAANAEAIATMMNLIDGRMLSFDRKTIE